MHRHFVLIVFLILADGMSFGQASLDQGVVGESLLVEHNCAYFGREDSRSVVTFASTAEAKDIIAEIIEASGLSKNFIVRAAGVGNALAIIKGATRYIVYDPTFIQNMERSSGTRWGPISVMAHEIGHHLNGHTLDQIGSRPDKELEADYYSGFVLQRMGGTLDQAQAAMKTLSSSSGSRTHPAREDRLTAIAAGWSNSCEADEDCGRTGGGDGGPITPPPSGPDSCEYSMDGQCDQPDICDPGTDTTDCSRPRYQLSGVCQTNFFSCRPGGEAPVGTPCWCNDGWGRPHNGRVIPE